MKFLFISHEGLMPDLADRIKKEGHSVKMDISSKQERDVGDGFVEKVDNWETHKNWAEVIVFDDSEFGTLPDRLRKEGKAVVGGTAYTDKLEMDRDFAQLEMKSVGMNILPCWDFESFDDAIKFLRENPQRVVIKPNGKAQNEKVLSYVGQEEDGKDALTMLDRYKKSWGHRMRSFQLQKFASGVEVAVGAFFNGKEFILPACVNFEHKRMFNDDIGPSTGEMGTSCFWADTNRLIREALLPMAPKIQGYVGYFDVNCIATARALYPLECTPRFGYPTINLQIEGVLSPWGEFLHAIANGQPYSLRTKRGFQIAVVVAVPPFPFEDQAAFRKYSEDAVIIFKKPIPEGLHPCDVKLVDGDWRLAGSSGYALVVTGSGATMEDARREAYNRVKNILIPNMFYRTDIGERWTRDGDLLQSWGYLS
jgi:phosphoribosylamine--glycine ligase